MRDRLTAGHRQRLRVTSAALGTAVARQSRLEDVAQARDRVRGRVRVRVRFRVRVRVRVRFRFRVRVRVR